MDPHVAPLGPLKPPDVRHVIKASSVTPIWMPLGQGSTLVPLKTTFDIWLPPCPLKPAKGTPLNHRILEMSISVKCVTNLEALGQGS